MEDAAVSSGEVAGSRATPIHLWIVGLLATLWNAFGACDYTMTRTENVDYLRTMMPKVDPTVILAWVDTIPTIPAAGWALGVWGGLVASLLLLMRSRHSVAAYLVSLVGAVVGLGYQFINRPPPELDNPVMSLVIIALAGGLFLYARTMRQKGVLA